MRKEKGNWQFGNRQLEMREEAEGSTGNLAARRRSAVGGQCALVVVVVVVVVVVPKRKGRTMRMAASRQSVARARDTHPLS